MDREKERNKENKQGSEEVRDGGMKEEHMESEESNQIRSEYQEETVCGFTPSELMEQPLPSPVS